LKPEVSSKRLKIYRGDAQGNTHGFTDVNGVYTEVNDPNAPDDTTDAQKTDTRDAEHLLILQLTDRFPHIWVPLPAARDLRQLLAHRNKVVPMRATGSHRIRVP